MSHPQTSWLLLLGFRLVIMVYQQIPRGCEAFNRTNKKKSTEETNQKQKVINIYGSQCLWRIRESKLAKVNTYRRCQIHHNSSELKIRLPTVA